MAVKATKQGSWFYRSGLFGNQQREGKEVITSHRIHAKVAASGDVCLYQEFEVIDKDGNQKTDETILYNVSK